MQQVSNHFHYALPQVEGTWTIPAEEMLGCAPDLYTGTRVARDNRRPALGGSTECLFRGGGVI